MRGNVVNVPVDVAPTIRQLPRNIEESQTIPVKLKKRKIYKTAVFHQNIRPIVVARAVELLCETPLYQNENIRLDDDWINRLHRDNEKADNTEDSMQNFFCRNDRDHDELHSEASRENRKDEADRIESTVESDSDGFSEVDAAEHNAGTCDTLLDQPDHASRTLVLAPGEDHRPSSLYHDTNAEYLAFPTIYGGKKPPENPKRKVHYSMKCKWECRHKSGKIGKSVPNLFFKMKKNQLKQVTDRVYLALRRIVRKNGEKIKAKDVKTDNGANLVKLDDGYEIFKTMRNSPPYLQKRKRDVFAMIRQLSTPTWFFSLSAADTRWTAVLRTLASQQWNRHFSDDEIDILTWEERCILVRNDPITCARYFENRCREFIKLIMSDDDVLGDVKDYFYRVEFQQRGSPHIHGLLWVKDAPKLEHGNEAEVANFIDQFISCSQNVTETEQQFLDIQRHKHSKTCRKKGKAICRFNYPLPPMSETRILYQLDEKDVGEKIKSDYVKIVKKLSELWEKKRDITYLQFLHELNMSEEGYLLAIRSSLTRSTVFLKREPSEIRINSYMKNLLDIWQANHDIQYVLDPYACAVYIVAYMSKSQRGMSILLDAAVKEARSGTSNIKDMVRHVGNKFTNAVETGAQEAAYLVLGLPLTKSSRKVTFVNTSVPDERTFLLKSADQLKALDDDATNISQKNMIDYYMERPTQLESMCFADFVSKIVVQKKTKKRSVKEDDILEEDDFADDEIREHNPLHDEIPDVAWRRHLPLKLANGDVIRLKCNPEVIRPVGFNVNMDSEKHYHEKLMLYSNWRNEHDLRMNGTYEQRYLQLENGLLRKEKEYDKVGSVLDEAKARVLEEFPDAFDQVAPNTEYVEAVDTEEGSKESEEFSLYLPESKSQQNYDIGIEFNAKAVNDDTEVRVRRLPDKEFYAGVRSLNEQQQEFFTDILQRVRDETSSFQVFLSGGAGVGKSHVIKMIYQALDRELSRHPGDDPDCIRILVMAPTGKAAFNIQGYTIHSALHVKPNQSLNIENQALGDSELNTLRSQLRELRIVIIDEVSMVGAQMLNVIDNRLRCIRGRNIPYGGLSVIFVGDLFQLKPVMDNWVFDVQTNGADVLGRNIWRDLVKLFELTTIMRQKDDRTYAELLNRMREGHHTESDIELLTTRSIQEGEYINVPHICCLNASVDAHNETLFNKAVEAGADNGRIRAQHIAVQSDALAVQNLKRFLESKKVSESCGGLEREVPVVVGQEYEMSVNLSADDGLMNGSSCVIRKLEYLRDESRQRNNPDIVWLDFRNPKIGINWKHKYSGYYTPGIDRTWIPMFAIRREFMYYHFRIARVQVPLRQAAAKTIHKCQGESKAEAVIDHTYVLSQPHSHYVAFSRVSNLQGLHILNMNRKKKTVGGEATYKNTATPDGKFITVDKKVNGEMKRLRESENKMQLYHTPVYSHTAGFTILFHNVRSLHAHIYDLRSDPNFVAADVICCAETRLRQTDTNSDYAMPGFNLYRFDQVSAVDHTRPPHGLALYAKANVVVLSTHGVSMPDYEWFHSRLEFPLGTVQVIGMYCAPKFTWAMFSQHDLERLLSKINFDERVILVGDFNSLSSSPLIETLRTERGLRQQINARTTIHGSCLDLIFTDIPTDVLTTGVIDVCWSDHRIIWCNVFDLPFYKN